MDSNKLIEMQISSMIGYIFVLEYSPISWKSSNKNNITLSITKAEYSSLIEYTKQAMWIKRLINELFNKGIRINIKIDNKPFKDIAENEKEKGWTKYIDIKYKYIQDEIIKNKINYN